MRFPNDPKAKSNLPISRRHDLALATKANEADVMSKPDQDGKSMTSAGTEYEQAMWAQNLRASPLVTVWRFGDPEHQGSRR